MQLDSLEVVLADQLKDIYSAETQVLKFMPKMVKGASSEALKTAFEEHRKQTEGQLARLDAIGRSLGVKLTGKKCKGMQGLLEEGKEVLEEGGDDPFVDIALIAAAQRVEHYEISAYQAARALAEQVTDGDVARLLQETLDEESATDAKLTELTQERLQQPLAEAETADDLVDADESDELEMDEEEDLGLAAEEVSDEELESGGGAPLEDEEGSGGGRKRKQR